MLDENLPVFFFRNSPDGTAHHKGVYYSIRGSEPSPAYNLRHGDPITANSRNCYAAGLFDCYNPDVLYGEVLIRPEWSHPTLSQEELRRNGGVPPPPSPILPTQFTVQLYNPDLQVTVTQKPGSWGGSASYEFSLPQLVFRTPSASTLDRTQDDPGASIATPKFNFVWRKESKLAKDLTCYMTGKSTDEVVKKKHRDPDIIVALLRQLRELTVYEPNLYRIELEDPKGLELVLLLSSAVIKDLYFTNDLNQTFNVFDPCRIASLPAATTSPQPPTNNAARRKSLPRLRTSPPAAPSASPPAARPAPSVAPDARTQWELDAETARLRAQVEAEEREMKRKEEMRRREREKADEAETRRLRRMVEEEEKEARRRQEEVDRETERLRKQYRLKPPSPVGNQHRHSAPSLPIHHQHPQPGPSRPTVSQGPSYASNGLLMSGANPTAASNGQPKMKKKSFFGLRSNSDQGNSKLSKKASAVW